MTENSLVIFTQAAKMLVEATTIQKAKELKDLALTAQDWVTRKKMGEQSIQHCRSYAFDAEKRMGELLKATERNPGTQPSKKDGGTMEEPPSNIPTLSDLGVTKKESSDAQFLASLPEAEFEEVKSGKTSKKAAKKKHKQKEKEKTRQSYLEELQQIRLTTPEIKVKPSLVLADPPWKYEYSVANNRKIENHYETMIHDDLINHKPDTADDCILLMWATAPKLAEAIDLLSQWGYEYRTCAVWDKEKIGMGYWFRGEHELLLVGIKGNVSPPQPSDRRSSMFRETRTKHSKKPESVYEWIESSFPEHEKLEMYCRSPRAGWQHLGNEV